MRTLLAVVKLLQQVLSAVAGEPIYSTPRRTLCSSCADYIPLHEANKYMLYSYPNKANRVLDEYGTNGDPPKPPPGDHLAICSPPMVRVVYLVVISCAVVRKIFRCGDGGWMWNERQRETPLPGYRSEQLLRAFSKLRQPVEVVVQTEGLRMEGTRVMYWDLMVQGFVRALGVFRLFQHNEI